MEEKQLNTIRLNDANNTIVTTRLSKKEFMLRYNKRKSFTPMREFDYSSVVIQA